ncbi:Eco57I restriction-modification methylase domain-containing protein [Lutibacter sp.]|uniref:Eco57I restriction-modification methylase domain-containing protein n=1 Tax=Lutibacter sp. TaxID=1925666 RepID=UPI0035696B7E
MSFFQSSVVTKQLQTQNKETIAIKWNVFKEHFHNPVIQENIRNSKEEQYQGEFLIDLFVNVLGYTKNPTPDFNLTTEYKNVKDSKKADGAIIINNIVRAVIELKGTNTTDLGKIETQAFGYKNNQPSCTYIVTANFEKLRFYIDNAVDYIEFNLFTLTEKEFEVLYLCLGLENIEKDIPKKIKNQSISQEDAITKKLYNDYSLFKRELYQNLVKLNPQFEPIDLFKKSQKLLDRFLFLFFAEDRQLLPPNSVRLILNQWKQLQELDEEIPLYNRFKKYFEYLNTGFKGKKYDVFAYNGGLFKPDAILDNIKIDDKLLFKHAKSLSEYDFESEVDVNILGHIFENSLNELDEIKAELEGETIDKTKTKRKKDGVFYTPKYITKYIVDNTVGKLCSEKKTELQLNEDDYATDKKRQKKTIKGLIDKLTEYRNWLLQLTICDPACGSGAFLNQALNFLIDEHKYIDELQAKLFGDAMVLSDVEKSILENNLFGVDLNEESVEIAKLSLWLRTAQPNRKLNDLNNNIKCGNSLIDDVAIAGDKAFNWRQEFPQIFTKGGFDIVIGNPPYVRRTQLNEVVKMGLEKEYYSAFKQYDLYVLFNELALNITKLNGVIGFIQPNKFLSAEYGFKILNLIINNSEILKIYDVSLDKVFSEASVYPYIFIFQKTSFNVDFENVNVNLFNYCRDEDLQGFDNIIKSKNIIKKIELNSKKITELTNSIKRGVPNSKLDFIENSSLVGIKSTLLEYPYYLPKSEVYIKYLDQKDLIIKVNEFSNKFILLPRTTLKIRAVIKQETEHILDRIYYFKIDNEDYLFDYVLSIINSKITTFYYDNIYGSTKIGGGYIDLKGSQIENFLVPICVLKSQQIFKKKSDLMFNLYQNFNENKLKFQRTVQRKFELDVLPKKLQDWYLLNFTQFVKELAKKKVKLSLSQEAEWEDYFLAEQQKATMLKQQIQTTDNEIDALVYELYGLTEEEIRIVEES